MYTLNATGWRLGFLIFKIWVTSVLKGPYKYVSSWSYLLGRKQVAHTLEGQLLGIYFDRHNGGKYGLQGKRRKAAMLVLRSLRWARRVSEIPSQSCVLVAQSPASVVMKLRRRAKVLSGGNSG